ncbi:MAG: hypothetical protein RH942_15150 [Kiloniellaceae bacterium]
MHAALPVTLCLSLLLPAALAAPAAAQDPAHLPVGPLRVQTRGLPPIPQNDPRPVNPLAGSNLLLEDDAPLTAFDLDRNLTKLCRKGRFRQQRQHLYIVRLAGYIHGAVIGGRWGLFDPEGLAVPNLVYALRWQDTGRCEVYVLRHLQG